MLSFRDFSISTPPFAALPQLPEVPISSAPPPSEWRLCVSSGNRLKQNLKDGKFVRFFLHRLRCCFNGKNMTGTLHRFVLSIDVLLGPIFCAAHKL